MVPLLENTILYSVKDWYKKMSILQLSNEDIVQYSIECIKYGKDIPQDIQDWLKGKGLLYQILNPIKEGA